MIMIQLVAALSQKNLSHVHTFCTRIHVMSTQVLHRKRPSQLKFPLLGIIVMYRQAYADQESHW